jgi:hypothetical protein
MNREVFRRFSHLKKKRNNNALKELARLVEQTNRAVREENLHGLSLF